jgi:hypothetical protein
MAVRTRQTTAPRGKRHRLDRLTSRRPRRSMAALAPAGRPRVQRPRDQLSSASLGSFRRCERAIHHLIAQWMGLLHGSYPRRGLARMMMDCTETDRCRVDFTGATVPRDEPVRARQLVSDRTSYSAPPGARRGVSGVSSEHSQAAMAADIARCLSRRRERRPRSVTSLLCCTQGPAGTDRPGRVSPPGMRVSLRNIDLSPGDRRGGARVAVSTATRLPPRVLRGRCNLPAWPGPCGSRHAGSGRMRALRRCRSEQAMLVEQLQRNSPDGPVRGSARLRRRWLRSPRARGPGLRELFALIRRGSCRCRC